MLFVFLAIFFPLLLLVFILSVAFAGVFLVGVLRGLLRPPPCESDPYVCDELED